MMNLIRKARAERGFTLVEIMIVVLIIGILLAIAVPNFVKARESSRAKACLANLKQIAAAKEQWALDNNKRDGAKCTMEDLVPDYIKPEPVCPSGGTYTVGDVGTNPTCDIHTQDSTQDSP